MQAQAVPIKFDSFQSKKDDDCQARILAAREKLGKRLVIFGGTIINMRACTAMLISQVTH